jgi:eukaryotic-like serine/threonine-protein kinase
MDPERWEPLSSWYNSWLAAGAEDRTRLRSRLAAERPDLLAEADALASASGELSGFLETPALAQAARELAEADPLLAGGTMVGPYQIVGLLASGGMGDLYRATDVRLRRDVALKMLVPARRDELQAVERFLQEARVTASFDHPNIVRVYDVGWFEGRAYLVAELLEGETLRSRIERGPMLAAEVIRTGAELASGLTAAHAAGLVHRDLKPENVFLLRSGTAKILDFGIAKLAQGDSTSEGPATHTGILLGTAGYLSPEQVRGEPVDPRADLFSLGAVLFEMLTGHRAFARQYLVDTLHAITHDPPTGELAGADGVPPSLATIVSRLLEKAPDDRFQSSAELLAALESVSVDEAGEPVPPNHRGGGAPSPGASRERLASERRFSGMLHRRRALSAAALGALVLVAAVLAWYSGEPRRHATVAATPSLAVLPFRSLPSDADSEWLELGLADVFIHRLGRLPGIRVLPLTATERHRYEDPREAGRRLGADMVLSGSLQRDQGRLRASVQLLSVPDERTMWADTVDSDASGMFSIQDAIVYSVVEQVAPELSPDARSRLVRVGTRNGDALEAYLRGRAHAFRPNLRDLGQAAELFRAALAHDPEYADAWAGLASVYRLMPIAAGSETRPGEAFPQAKDAAERALLLDPEHAEALAVLGNVAFWYDWDYPRAEQFLRRAVALQARSALARSMLAHLLSNLGRHAEALEEIRRARELEPSWLAAQGLEIQVLFFARRYDEALRAADAMVQLEPRSLNAHIWRTYPLLSLGRYEEAVNESLTGEKLLEEVIGDGKSGPWPWAQALRGYALARLGRRAEAEAVLAGLRARASERYVPRHHLALVLHALGRDEEALEQLREAIEERDVFATFLGVDPKWDGLRRSPAFRELLSRVNLLEVSDAIRPHSD